MSDFALAAGTCIEEYLLNFRKETSLMSNELASLAPLVRLATQCGLLLATPLTQYQEHYGLDDVVLSTRLECSCVTLMLLKLCEMPRLTHFQQDCARIAQYTQIHPPILEHLLSQLCPSV